MSEVAYTKKDFVSDQDVRWCPGCGDYSILAAVQMVMPKIGVKKEDIVFVSGIGCSSRFPYYMNTYGLHTIHGRAPAIASGLKLSRPDLSVWVITGDGDALSIGGNHFIHAIRRNLNLNIILFNNEIYGLTKGQYSPTSEPGLVTKSTPYGSIDRPFQASSLAIGAESSFYARTTDTDIKHMQQTFLRAAAHQGTSVVEVLQNCVIFNDKVHQKFTDRKTKDDYVVYLEDGKPLIFGAEKNKGIVLEGLSPKVVTLGENAQADKDLVVHDEKALSTYAHLLGRFDGEKLPLPLGVFRAIEAAVYDEGVKKQMDDVSAQKGPGSVEKLLHTGETWEVSE